MVHTQKDHPAVVFAMGRNEYLCGAAYARGILQILYAVNRVRA